jgi:archaellum component FlaF (FlaF/FlaG flagellin family)
MYSLRSDDITLNYTFGYDLAFQMDMINSFHVGEVVTSVQKATLIPGGSESLVYTTLSGGIGMLVPFTSHEVSMKDFAYTPLHQQASNFGVKGAQQFWLKKGTF